MEPSPQHRYGYPIVDGVLVVTGEAIGNEYQPYPSKSDREKTAVQSDNDMVCGSIVYMSV